MSFSCRLTRRSLLPAAILCVFAVVVVSVARLLLIYEQTFAPPIEPAFIRLRGLWLAHLQWICAGNLRANRSHRVYNFTMNATYLTNCIVSSRATLACPTLFILRRV